MPDPEPGNNRPESEEGVFGNLPASRPGRRSPRRDAATTDRGPVPQRPAPRRASAPPSPPPPDPDTPGPPSAAEREAPVPTQPGDDPQITSVEDLAWAGIAVAAQAVTVGVRVASRALEAARKSIEPPR